MDNMLLQNLALKWDLEDIHTAFYKCVRWQAEVTNDPLDCSFRYFCDSKYPGNYPQVVDILVLIFATSSYLATLILVIIELSKRGSRPLLIKSMRYFLPSGPIFLPIILLVFAKGNRINSSFPISSFGPAIFQLVQISALTFDNGENMDLKYAFFEASTISGVLHASLYLDSVILPYYTGFDALRTSSLSGDCISCICRKEPLVVGGKSVSYRGRSATTFLVVGALSLRILCRVREPTKRRVGMIKCLFEALGWVVITMDCVYLVKNPTTERSTMRSVAFVSILSLICVCVSINVCTRIVQWQRQSNQQKQES
ncbi:hypothetical protein ACFE04_018013 [Oxalis oulophora]